MQCEVLALAVLYIFELKNISIIREWTEIKWEWTVLAPSPDFAATFR